jgi:DedD protein
MAFFKLHKGANKSRSATPALGSVENLRRKVRHRLIGATVLVSLGVVGFPKLFDSEPRPLPVNVPITIHSATTTAASATATTATTSNNHSKLTPLASLTSLQRPPSSSAMITESEEGTREIPPSSGDSIPSTRQALAPKDSSTAARPVHSLPSPPKPKNKDKEKAKSKSKSKSEPEPADKPAKPFIVHLGTFTDSAKARAVRLKAESAGLSTYTQIVERKQEKRILVRIGPMKLRSEADSTAARVRKLDLSASVLER